MSCQARTKLSRPLRVFSFTMFLASNTSSALCRQLLLALCFVALGPAIFAVDCVGFSLNDIIQSRITTASSNKRIAAPVGFSIVPLNNVPNSLLNPRLVSAINLGGGGGGASANNRADADVMSWKPHGWLPFKRNDEKFAAVPFNAEKTAAFIQQLRQLVSQARTGEQQQQQRDHLATLLASSDGSGGGGEPVAARNATVEAQQLSTSSEQQRAVEAAASASNPPFNLLSNINSNRRFPYASGQNRPLQRLPAHIIYKAIAFAQQQQQQQRQNKAAEGEWSGEAAAAAADGGSYKSSTTQMDSNNLVSRNSALMDDNRLEAKQEALDDEAQLLLRKPSLVVKQHFPTSRLWRAGGWPWV